MRDVSYDELQERLVPLWRSIRALSDDAQTIVVVPSVTFDFASELGGIVSAYEERYLFLLLLLRQPRAHIIYVTSKPISGAVVDYYLGLMPGVIPSHARRRLHLVSAEDGSGRSLTQKILERPRLQQRIRSLISDPQRAHLVPFVTTGAERDLALALGIPIYGADPKHFPLGTKSGCRRLFAEEGVSHPFGFEDLRTLPEVVDGIAKMRAGKPSLAAVVVKLDEGVGGLGNAVVSLQGLPLPGDASERPAIEHRLGVSRAVGGRPFDELASHIATQACAVEELLTGSEVRSPSVQMRATPLGELEILSTHDQLLGGDDGQSYEGCLFPADAAYAPRITHEAAKIGRRLVREGVLGRFAVDFVVTRDAGGSWSAYAIELNLRKGGTTHPFLTLQFLTDGTYDAERAEFRAPNGARKYFVASDHVASDAYRGLTVEDLFDIVVRRGLHFDHARQTGVVMHMMSAVTEFGRLGLTAVGDSREAAGELYGRAVAALDEEAAF